MRRIAIALAILALLMPSAARADLPFVTSLTSTSAITTAATTQVYAATNHPTLIYWLAVQSSAANSSDTFQFEYSPNASCVSSNTVFTPAGQSPSASSGGIVPTISGSMGNGAQVGAFSPAAVPFLLPAGNYVCVVTAGTTIALYALMYYAQL